MALQLDSSSILLHWLARCYIRLLQQKRCTCSLNHPHPEVVPEVDVLLSLVVAHRRPFQALGVEHDTTLRGTRIAAAARGGSSSSSSSALALGLWGTGGLGKGYTYELLREIVIDGVLKQWPAQQKAVSGAEEQ